MGSVKRRRAARKKNEKKRSSGKCEEQRRARRNNQVSVEQREKAAAVGFQTGGEQSQSCSAMKFSGLYTLFTGYSNGLFMQTCEAPASLGAASTHRRSCRRALVKPHECTCDKRGAAVCRIRFKHAARRCGERRRLKRYADVSRPFVTENGSLVGFPVVCVCV